MNTILAAQMISYGTPGAPNPTSVRQGAYQTPFTKALSQNTAAVFPAELKPVTNVKVASQGSTDQFVVFSHYGPCPLVPDNNNTPGMTPYSTTQMRDDFNLPIAGAPAPGQKALMFQTAAGNPIALGTTSTSPDGITSPQIPNTGDVTPGTAAANPGAVASGPVTKQHPWITDIVTHWGLFQIAYGKYDYEDPTGTVHTSLGKGDKKVKKPQVNVLLHADAVNTGSPGSTVSVPGYASSLYNLSGMTFDPTTFGVRVAEGYALSRNPSTLDFTIRTSATLPAADTGDQTARQFPGYAGTTYNTSALDYDAITKAAYVKIDGTTIKQTALGELMSVGGGGGGGGTGSPVVLRLDGVSHGAFANHTEVNLAWSSVGLDHGGWVTAGTQATGPDIIIPVTGTYGLMIVQEVDLSSTPASGSFCHIDILRNGISIAGDDFEAELTLLEFPTLVWNSTFDFTAGDVIHIGLSNRTGVTISADLGTTSLWLIQSQPSTVAFSCYDLPSLVGGALAPSGTAFVRWDSGIEIDEGGWVAAGTDAAGSNMVIPVAGTYDVNLQLKLTHPIAGSAEVVQIYVFINGAGVYTFEYDVSNLTNSIIEFHKNIVFALHDAVKFRVNNYTVHNLVLAQGHIDLHKV